MIAVGQMGLGFSCDTGGLPNRSLSQWDTRPDTACELVRWAGVRPGDRVLEPSAGKGNVVAALVAAECSVVAVELDRSRANALAQRFLGVADPHPIHCDDFLEFAARVNSECFDVVVGNPPFECGLDLAFVLAGLRLAPRVVFLLRLAFLEGKDRHERLWSRHHLARLRVFSGRERFEGDTEGSPKSAMAFFDIRRGSPEKSIVGWM